MQGNEIEKDVFSSCHESGTKKQSQTLTGLEPSWIRSLLRIFFLAHTRHKTKKCLSLIIFVVVVALFVCLFVLVYAERDRNSSYASFPALIN